MSQVEFPIIFKLVKSISQMSLYRGGGWGGVGWDTALQKLVSYISNLIGLPMVILIPLKCCQIDS